MADSRALVREINALTDRLSTGETTFLDLLKSTKQRALSSKDAPQFDADSEVFEALEKFTLAAAAAFQREQRSILTNTLYGIGYDVAKGKIGEAFFAGIRKVQ